MKQAMIKLFLFLGITNIRYYGKKRMFYVKNEFGEDMTINEQIEIPLTVGTFYGLAKQSGIQSPTAFALTNGNNLVKGRK
jgi:hypothetical protein